MRRAIALLLGLCLAAVTPPSRADLVMSNGDGTRELRLYESICSHAGTLTHIPAEFRTRFQNARILDRRGTIEAYGCWAEVEETVLIVFEDGSRTDFKLSKFKDPVI
jgi:hypothetical protein